MKAVLEYIEEDNESVKTFWFRPERAVRNVPGQFTELHLPHKNSDDRGDKRWFTIFSSPTEDLFAITTKFATNSSTFKQEMLRLQPGTTHDFAEPMGDFILPKDKSIPLVFVAGGIGVTPFRSIAKWLSDKDESRSIRLLYAVQLEEDLLFIDTLESADIAVTPIVQKPTPDWSGKTGQLTPEIILSLITDPKTHTYLSGPEAMVEKLTKSVIMSGTPKHKVITDYFPGYNG